MVKFQAKSLDRTFAALADPTRRQILTELGVASQLAVTEIARPYAVSLPAVLKHLGVLERAGLITRQKSGRTVRCRLNAAPMEEAVAWLSKYERFWSERLDALAAYVEDDPCPIAPSRASPSSASSGRARKRSSRRGRGPKR